MRKVVRSLADACEGIFYAASDPKTCFTSADEIVKKHLALTGEISHVESGTGVGFTSSRSGRFAVAVAPLDSSMCDPSDPAGTSFGVWSSLVNSSSFTTGRDIVVAGLATYSGRSPGMILSLSGTNGVFFFKLVRGKGWILDRKIFGQDRVSLLVQENMGTELSESEHVKEPRHFGSRVVDVANLIKEGSGTLVIQGKSSMMSSIRLLTEVVPLAYLVEAAGGYSSYGEKSILDLGLESFSAGAKYLDRSDELANTPGFGNDFSSTAPVGKKLILSAPRGFCEGVQRAVDTVEEALRIFGAPLYVKHEIVHNRIVCDRLKAKGAIFVEDLNEVPEGSRLVYSAHGIPPQVRDVARKRRLLEIDATCPLVTKVHVYARKKAKEGYKIIVVGHKDHIEVIGVVAEAPEVTTVVENVKDVKALPFSKNDKLFFVTQTTLSLDDVATVIAALKEAYPSIESIPSGSICYATTNRQGALRAVVDKSDLVLVVGDPMSSNALRLAEAAETRSVKAHLIRSSGDIKQSWVDSARTIVLTAGASTPEDVVQACVERLRELGVTSVEEFVYTEEDMSWKLPRNLEAAIKEHDGKARIKPRKNASTQKRGAQMQRGPDDE